MNVAIVLTLVVLAGVVAWVLWRSVGRTWLRYRGTRVVTCPETGRPAAVDVDAAHAAWGALGGPPELRLQDCTRWPERAGCGEECLAQIETSPEECAVKTILSHWYRERECALCGKAFDEIHWHDHKPGLISPDHELVEWNGFRPETVGDVLKTHRPVCWNCMIAERFRREHGDRVVDRDRSATT